MLLVKDLVVQTFSDKYSKFCYVQNSHFWWVQFSLGTYFNFTRGLFGSDCYVTSEQLFCQICECVYVLCYHFQTTTANQHNRMSTNMLVLVHLRNTGGKPELIILWQ